MKLRVQLIGALVTVGLLTAVQMHFLRCPITNSDSSGAEGIGQRHLIASKGLFQVSNATEQFAPSALTAPTCADIRAPTDAFQEFSAWVRGYLALPPKSRANTVADGLALAKTRRTELQRLIAEDPERAWNLRLPWSVRRELPPVIAEQLEEIVSGRGELSVLGALPLPGQTDGFRPVQSLVTLDNRSYQAFVFGRRASQPTRSGISLHGIVVDGALALSDSPMRVLEPEELPKVGKAFAGDTCPVSGKSTAVGSASQQEDGVVVESGSEVFRLCSSTHVAALDNALWQQEAAVASSVGFDNVGNNSLLVMPVDFPDLPGANTAKMVSFV
jgi:hypothetical protein